MGHRLVLNPDLLSMDNIIFPFHFGYPLIPKIIKQDVQIVMYCQEAIIIWDVQWKYALNVDTIGYFAVAMGKK